MAFDETEAARRKMLPEVNAVTQSEDGTSRDELAVRADLEQRYGQVWNYAELRHEFDVESFLAPFVTVRRKSDRRLGTMEFTHQPRLYYSFTPHNS